MNAIPITLAQAAAGLPAPTPGQMVSFLCAVGCMAASLVMISVWIARHRMGVEVMPFAARKPLYVPMPLVAFGLLLAVLGTVSVFTSGTIDPDLLQPAEENEIVDEGSAADNAAEQSALGDGADAAAAGSTGADVADGSEEEASKPDKLSPAALKQKLRLVMLANFGSNLVVFVIFGLTIWIFQQHRSRRQMTIQDVGYESGYGSSTAGSLERFPDLDAQPDHEAIPDSGNIYALPREQDEEQLSELQKWSLPRELRFAFETFLVAYLPTSLIRVIMAASTPDPKSHPFLEMLENGVDVEIMVLIFLAAVVVAPVVEELMFRVAIFGGMYQRNSFLPGLIVSSVLFGLAHGYPDCFALMPLAVAIAFTYSRRRSYRTAVLVHFLFNGFNMVLAGISLV